RTSRLPPFPIPSRPHTTADLPPLVAAPRNSQLRSSCVVRESPPPSLAGGKSITVAAVFIQPD
uniref:Uncharacterized protein n=1 Tax=Cucumis melo TaxID=3656 RepID=A0A9I9E3U2_CUCME